MKTLIYLICRPPNPGEEIKSCGCLLEYRLHGSLSDQGRRLSLNGVHVLFIKKFFCKWILCSQKSTFSITMVFSLAFMPWILSWDGISQGAIFQQKCRNVQSDGGERGSGLLTAHLPLQLLLFPSHSFTRLLGKSLQINELKIDAALFLLACDTWKVAPLPLENTHLKFLLSCECYLIWKKRAFVSVIMLRFWEEDVILIIPIGPECHHKRPYKREKREILDRRGEEIVTQRIRQSEDRDWRISPRDQKAGHHSRAGMDKELDSSIAPRETIALLRFWSCSLQNCEKINFCYFKLVVTCLQQLQELINCTIKKPFSKVWVSLVASLWK